MRCPHCEKPLVVTHHDYYEDISEHVSGCAVSMKSGYQCLSRNCIANQLGAVWTSDGERYSDPPEGIRSSTWVLSRLALHGDGEALDTFMFTHGQREKLVYRRTLRIRLWKSPEFRDSEIVFHPIISRKGNRQRFPWYRISLTLNGKRPFRVLRDLKRLDTGRDVLGSRGTRMLVDDFRKPLRNFPVLLLAFLLFPRKSFHVIRKCRKVLP